MKHFKLQLIPFVVLLLLSTQILAEPKAKILYINSYHAGYDWSDGIETGIQNELRGKNIDLKIIHLDTKRNTSSAFYKKAAKKARAAIRSFQPDVVIASDDNASKHLIVPFYKNSPLPFVFCGVNWDAKEYGYPFSNVTGMVEVTPIPQLLGQLQKYTEGQKIGFIGPDIFTAKKEAQNYQKVFNLKFKSYFSKDYKDWKKGFIQMQKQVDILIIDSDGGLYAKYSDEMQRFVKMNTKIPTGTTYEFMAPFAMITFAKVSEEQGRWSAKQALKILGGTSPADIPITKNRQGRLIFNLKIANSLQIHIPDQDLEYASKVIE